MSGRSSADWDAPPGAASWVTVISESWETRIDDRPVEVVVVYECRQTWSISQSARAQWLAVFAMCEISTSEFIPRLGRWTCKWPRGDPEKYAAVRGCWTLHLMAVAASLGTTWKDPDLSRRKCPAVFDREDRSKSTADGVGRRSTDP